MIFHKVTYGKFDQFYIQCIFYLRLTIGIVEFVELRQHKVGWTARFHPYRSVSLPTVQYLLQVSHPTVHIRLGASGRRTIKSTKLRASIPDMVAIEDYSFT